MSIKIIKMMDKNKIIKTILKINPIYDINWLESCDDILLNKILINNMIVSQGYGNKLNMYLKF